MPIIDNPFTALLNMLGVGLFCVFATYVFFYVAGRAWKRGRGETISFNLYTSTGKAYGPEADEMPAKVKTKK